MSRDPYRSSTEELGYSTRPRQRWDAERFAAERDRGSDHEQSRFEERDDVRSSSGPRRAPRPRDHSPDTDDFFDRRENRGAFEDEGSRGGFEDDYIRKREVYHEEPRTLPVRSRRPSISIEREREMEREREYYRTPSPPPMRRPARPSMLRRQSSLDTFDRMPTRPRYMEREEYGPPALRREHRPAPPDMVPRYVERGYEEDMRAYPGRVREREIIRTRRRSRSRSSSCSDSSASTMRTSKSKFPKRGKTRMPARLVSTRAIIELGYRFEEEGNTIIIQKALGRENIDEVIQLSEFYKREIKTQHAEKVVEEKHTEIIYGTHEDPHSAPRPQIIYDTHEDPHRAPRPQTIHDTHEDPHCALPPQIIQVGPPPATSTEIAKTQTTTIEEHEHMRLGPPAHYRHHRSRSMGPTPHHHEFTASSDSLAIYDGHHHHHHGHNAQLIRSDIRALSAEAEALRAERRAEKQLRRADKIRSAGYSRAADGELVLVDKEGVAEVRRDRKGPNPRAIRTMLKMLT